MTRCCEQPRCNHPCPLCPLDHERCEFTSGSLWCVKPGCGNPHHRAAP